MAMIVAAVVISCLVNSWMMSHLGKNPVRGGSPASDSKVSMRVALSMGVFVHEVIIVDSFTVLIVFRVRKTAVVVREYR